MGMGVGRRGVREGVWAHGFRGGQGVVHGVHGGTGAHRLPCQVEESVAVHSSHVTKWAGLGGPWRTARGGLATADRGCWAGAVPGAARTSPEATARSSVCQTQGTVLSRSALGPLKHVPLSLPSAGAGRVQQQAAGEGGDRKASKWLGARGAGAWGQCRAWAQQVAWGGGRTAFGARTAMG